MYGHTIIYDQLIHNVSRVLNCHCDDYIASAWLSGLTPPMCCTDARAILAAKDIATVTERFAAKHLDRKNRTVRQLDYLLQDVRDLRKLHIDAIYLQLELQEIINSLNDYVLKDIDVTGYACALIRYFHGYPELPIYLSVLLAYGAVCKFFNTGQIDIVKVGSGLIWDIDSFEKKSIMDVKLIERIHSSIIRPADVVSTSTGLNYGLFCINQQLPIESVTYNLEHGLKLCESNGLHPKTNNEILLELVRLGYATDHDVVDPTDV